jgi:hypothetical protein
LQVCGSRLCNNQQVVIKQLVVQVKALQKQLDTIKSAINRFKNIPKIKEKSSDVNPSRN